MPSSHSQSSWWPLALLGTALVLLSLRKSPVATNGGQPIHPQDSTGSKNPDISRQATLIANPAPTPPNPGNANGDKHKTPLWEKLAVGIALGLLVVNFFQMRATQDAVRKASEGNEISRQSLTASQRPWVSFSDVTFSNPPKFIAPPIPNAPIQMELTITSTLRNVGLSAATKVNPIFYVTPVDQVGLPPVIIPPCEAPSKGSRTENNEPTIFLMPQDKIPHTETTATNPERGGLFKTIRKIWVEACVTYQDSSGNFYRTKLLYDSFSRDDAQEIVAVPGHGLTYKPIQGWNLWSADVDEVKQ